MFWDERAATLEDQVLQPVQNTTEMGLTLDELVTKASAQTYMPPSFKKPLAVPLCVPIKYPKHLPGLCAQSLLFNPNMIK